MGPLDCLFSSKIHFDGPSMVPIDSESSLDTGLSLFVSFVCLLFIGAYVLCTVTFIVLHLSNCLVYCSLINLLLF